MNEPRSISRRGALTGLRAGALGLTFASQFATAKARSQSVSFADHPLTGLWLNMVTLSSDPETTVAVPSIFGADGSTVLIFPCTERSQSGVLVKGAPIGTWEAVDDSSGHFTAVQVIANVEGDHMGTLTIEGLPSVDEASSSFEDNRPDNRTMFRDAFNAAVAESPLPTPIRMLGYRMTLGDISFDSALGEQQPRTLPSRPGPRP